MREPTHTASGEIRGRICLEGHTKTKYVGLAIPRIKALSSQTSLQEAEYENDEEEREQENPAISECHSRHT